MKFPERETQDNLDSAKRYDLTSSLKRRADYLQQNNYSSAFILGSGQLIKIDIGGTV